MSQAQTTHDGETLSVCWCESSYVTVPERWVREGRTRRCQKKRCRPTRTQR